MTTSVRTRWAGSGASSASESDKAGREACLGALAGREDAALLVVFASDVHDMAALTGAIRACAPGVPLIGCSTAGEIASSGVGDSGVVVMALGGPGFAVSTA